MIPYLVSAFDKSTLSNLVKESFGSDFPDIFKKTQIDYIYRYLKDLGAKSILLEFEYVDKDFLEDYSRYYVKSFNSTGNKCARLHFFSSTVTHGVVEEALVSSAADHAPRLQNSYLGFIVVKPLPKTFIGKTCLSHYPAMVQSANRRCIVRPYHVDLFGIKLIVESVAFQEQDKVVSACATTAIWSTLHAMKWRAIRSIPACSEITINAINHIDGSSNNFPSKELSNKQILRALDVERFRNHFLKLNRFSQERFLKTIRYHVDSNLPMILGADVYSISADKELSLRAGHAVSVLGYKNSERPVIYIHDDRLGPFARATFVDLTTYKAPPGSELASTWGVVLQEKDDSGTWKEPHEVLVPTSLIIPSPRKVRLSYEFAEATCDFIKSEYDTWIQELKEKRDVASVPQVAFSLRLAEISAIRQQVVGFDFAEMGGESDAIVISNLNRKKVSFLTNSYARFHWVADFNLGGQPAFSILFDATDIPQGKGVTAIFEKNSANSELVLGIFAKYANAGPPESESAHFYNALQRHLQKPELDYEQYLSNTYGGLRAPHYLKANETRDGNVANNAGRRQYYGSCSKALEDELGELLTKGDPQSFLIWAIAHDGSLLIGQEIDQIGHPGLTRFKPARIAGELKWQESGWYLNSKSGRYSGDYINHRELLENAVEKFKTVFYLSRESIFASHKPASEAPKDLPASVDVEIKLQ